MVHDRNKLPIHHKFSVDSTIQMCQFHFSFFAKTKMCSLGITLFECYKLYKMFLYRDRRKLPNGEMFLKAHNTFPYGS